MSLFPPKQPPTFLHVEELTEFIGNLTDVSFRMRAKAIDGINKIGNRRIVFAEFGILLMSMFDVSDEKEAKAFADIFNAVQKNSLLCHQV